MAQHKVTVTRQDNKLVCEPDETVAKRGDVITWEGPAGGPQHTGRFMGKLKEAVNDPAKPPAKKRGFKHEDLRPEHLEPGLHPATAKGWKHTEPVTIRNDAASGVYAYMVEVQLGPNQKIDSDPVVIIED